MAEPHQPSKDPDAGLEGTSAAASTHNSAPPIPTSITGILDFDGKGLTFPSPRRRVSGS